MRRWIASLIFVGMAALILIVPAWAGGWAVVTLDQLPGHVIAGQPLTIGFMVRQHGRRPMEGLTPKITLARAGTGESLTVYAEPQGAVGHYVAMLRFPGAGTWTWSIDAFGAFEQPMPPLTALASAPDSPTASPSPAPISLPRAIGVIGALGAVGALIALWRTRASWAAALTLTAALAATVGFASGGNDAARVAQPARLSPAETGQALFLAKGCVICHQHAAVAEARQAFAGFSVGPNLTHLSADPAFLRRWLKDPSAVKPGSEMPTLGLSDEEIEALVAFLTAPYGQ